VVRHGEIESEQSNDGADQALGLTEGESENRPQRQRRHNRQARIVWLSTRRGPRLRLPRCDRLLREPDGEAAPFPQGGIILGQLVTRYFALGILWRRLSLYL
jgi:hypothetical protein